MSLLPSHDPYPPTDPKENDLRVKVYRVGLQCMFNVHCKIFQEQKTFKQLTLLIRVLGKFDKKRVKKVGKNVKNTFLTNIKT